MRVQPGRPTENPPMLMVLRPFQASETVSASVELTLLDSFKESCELAGLFLTDESSREFGAEKMNLNGHLFFHRARLSISARSEAKETPSSMLSNAGPQTTRVAPSESSFVITMVFFRSVRRTMESI